MKHTDYNVLVEKIGADLDFSPLSGWSLVCGDFKSSRYRAPAVAVELGLCEYVKYLQGVIDQLNADVEHCRTIMLL